jgi:hypothetical protein
MSDDGLRILTGDFNGDGFADLAASRGSRFLWYYGSPSGISRTATLGDSFLPGGGWYFAGDVNLDGQDEILQSTGSPAARELRYLYAARLPPAMVPSGYGDGATGGFDLDRNGASDLFIGAPAGRDTDYHVIFGSPGVAPTAGPRRFTVAGGLMSVNDVDGNGAQDLVSLVFSPSRAVVWVMGSFPSDRWIERVGSAEATTFDTLNGGTDLDGDGAMEVLIGNSAYAGGIGQVSILQHLTTGARRVDVVGPMSDVGFGGRIPILGDFNNDGFGDFVVSVGPSPGQLQVIFGAVSLLTELRRSSKFPPD